MKYYTLYREVVEEIFVFGNAAQCCRNNCYPSDGALWCLCPKLMLFIYLRVTALVPPDRPVYWSDNRVPSVSYPIASEPVQMGYGHLNWLLLCC